MAIEKLLIKVKKTNPNAIIPFYQKDGDAGLDLTAVTRQYDKETSIFTYGTGLSLEIPDGYVGLVFPRSSLSKKDLILTNHVGVVDSGYRGEITFKFKPNIDFLNEVENEFLSENTLNFYKTEHDKIYGRKSYIDVYAVGERIGQIIIMPYPKVSFVDIKDEELSETDRGDGGYGSTGN